MSVLSFLSRRFSKTKKAPGVASSGLEMFLNRQPRMNAAAYSQNLSLTGDPHESPENHSKSPNLSVDLNSDLNSEGKKINKAFVKNDSNDFPKKKKNSHGFVF